MTAGGSSSTQMSAARVAVSLIEGMKRGADGQVIRDRRSEPAAAKHDSGLEEGGGTTTSTTTAAEREGSDPSFEPTSTEDDDVDESEPEEEEDAAPPIVVRRGRRLMVPPPQPVPAPQPDEGRVLRSHGRPPEPPAPSREQLRRIFPPARSRGSRDGGSQRGGGGGAAPAVAAAAGYTPEQQAIIDANSWDFRMKPDNPYRATFIKLLLNPQERYTVLPEFEDDNGVAEAERRLQAAMGNLERANDSEENMMREQRVLQLMTDPLERLRANPQIRRMFKLALPSDPELETLRSGSQLHNMVLRTFQLPLYQPRLVGSPAPGVLAIGPPGTGKTNMAAAVRRAYRQNLVFIILSKGESKSEWVGRAEKTMEHVYSAARDVVLTGVRDIVVVFWDEFDSLVPSRETNNGIQAKDSADAGAQAIVPALLEQMDGVRKMRNVMTMGATNLPWRIDPAILQRISNFLFVDLPENETRLITIEKALEKQGIPVNVFPTELRHLLVRITGMTLRGWLILRALRILFPTSTEERTDVQYISSEAALAHCSTKITTPELTSLTTGRDVDSVMREAAKRFEELGRRVRQWWQVPHAENAASVASGVLFASSKDFGMSARALGLSVQNALQEAAQWKWMKKEKPNYKVTKEFLMFEEADFLKPAQPVRVAPSVGGGGGDDSTTIAPPKSVLEAFFQSFFRQVDTYNELNYLELRYFMMHQFTRPNDQWLRYATALLDRREELLHAYTGMHSEQYDRGDLTAEPRQYVQRYYNVRVT